MCSNCRANVEALDFQRAIRVDSAYDLGCAANVRETNDELYWRTR